MLTAYADRGATGEQIADSYRTIYRALPALAPAVARFIEERAEPGTAWADAYSILAN